MTNELFGFKIQMNDVKEKNMIPALSKEKEKRYKEFVIDPSSAQFIDLPVIEKPDFDEDRKPDEYWEVYNTGLSHYNRKWYEKAKNEFMKLLNYDNPHKTFYTDITRTYRKLIKKEMDKKSYQNAHDIYKEFLIVCNEYITDTDRRKYNKIIDLLAKESPDNYSKLEYKSEPDYNITDSKGRISFLSEWKMEKDTKLKNIKLNYMGQNRTGSIYYKSIYDKELSRYDETLFVMKNFSGNISKDFSVNHGVYRFKIADDSDRFVVSSDDMVLYYYSISDGNISAYNLKIHTDNKYHIRCIDISPDGWYLLFSHIDKVCLMDSNFNTIGVWKVPPKEGWEKRTHNGSPAEIEKHETSLSTLKLSGRPNEMEIKKAFRTLALKYHPDTNPGDPMATERTRDIISAYEQLTGEDAKKAFSGIENAEYYYQMIDKIKVEIPGMSTYITLEFGMTGPGEDWIYATYLSHKGESIYLGCYSGKVYHISNKGNVIRYYDCHDVVREIREKGSFLFLCTDYSLYIIKNNKYLTHIETWKKGDLRWGDNGFFLLGTKDLILFSDNGSELGKIIFKNSIHDVYLGNTRLNVVISKKVYEFSIL